MTIPQDVIDDLCSRFIINIPQEERQDVIRICFHIELAHWFYIDHYCPNDAKLPKCQFKEFARIIFATVPFLVQYSHGLERHIERWRDYKMAVPTYGAILLNKELDQVLLVQGFWGKSSWGFPKGKVNADEDPVVCACREVLEETGYDCASAISAKDYIELHIQDTLIRLYIVTGVDINTIFKPKTMGEIKNCNWFKISDLPQTRKDGGSNNVSDSGVKSLRPSAFFMAIPFIKPLRKWINRRRKSMLMTPSDEPILERKFWSTTWENVRIDWDEILNEVNGLPWLLKPEANCDTIMNRILGSSFRQSKTGKNNNNNNNNSFNHEGNLRGCSPGGRLSRVPIQLVKN